jgi:hypothetical protein
MNNLIERYVYDVVRRLPELSRTEVEKELKANIADMLPENPSQEAVEKTLASLGAPAKLAEQYRTKPRYLISPAVFDEYLTVLKLVIAILAVVLIVIKLFSDVLNTPNNGNYGQLISAILGGVFESLFSAITTGFLWVTLGFALMDYFNVSKSRPWSVKDLPEIPPKEAIKISRVETVIGMVFSAFFLVLMIRYQSFFGWYKSGPDGFSLPLFNSDAVSRYIPYLAMLTALSWIVGAMKFFYARWNYIVAAFAGLGSILWTAASILFLKGADTFNPAFIHQLGLLLKIDNAAINSHWQTGITVICVVSLIGTAIDFLSNLMKARKGRVVVL